MSRYEVIRWCSKGPQDGLPNYERHPDQPADGFQYATEANLWAIERDLGSDWRIWPIDAQPVRLSGVQ